MHKKPWLQSTFLSEILEKCLLSQANSFVSNFNSNEDRASSRPENRQGAAIRKKALLKFLRAHLKFLNLKLVRSFKETNQKMIKQIFLSFNL